MGYDAVGVTKDDLIAGLAFFQGIVEASSFPWLSANLVDSNTKKSLFTPSVVVTKGRLNLGILALTSAALPKEFSKSNQVYCLPWQEVLPSLLVELKPKSDIIILLSNLSVRENNEISESFPEINIIIQAGIVSTNMAPTLFNNTLIGQTAKQGKQIGIMEINWQDSPWGSKKPEELQNKKNSLDRLLWQLSKFQKYSNPLEDLQSDPNKLKTYRNLLQRKNIFEQEISNLAKDITQEGSALSPGKIPSTFKNLFIAMETSLPDHQGVVSIVDEINQQINEIGKKQVKNRVKEESKYVGSKQCGSCHIKELSIWQKSQHARAYTTLLNKKQHFNLDCLPCHITGSMEMDQGDALNLGVDFHGVGCENCHGPGKEHTLDPKIVRLNKIPEATICLTCHTDDHDGSFEYIKYVSIIKH